jgi:hypothetical protein
MYSARIDWDHRLGDSMRMLAKVRVCEPLPCSDWDADYLST